MQRTRQISFRWINWLYLIILLGLIFIPLIMQWAGVRADTTNAQLIQTMILEIAIIGLPAFLFLWFGSDDRKAAYKVKPLPVLDILLVGGMAATGYGFIIFVNLIWYAILSLLGEPMGQEVPAITTGSEFLLAVAALGIVPAFCEEMFFRGLMLNAYERRLKWAPAVVMVGVLFALYHILLMTIPSIIILGVMITFVVYRTRSIWAGVLYHFVHNFLSVCIAYAQPKLMEYMESSGMPAEMPQLEGNTLMSGIIAWGVIGAFCLALFGVFTWLLHYRTRDIVRPAAAIEKTSVIEWLPVILAGALIIYMWVIQIIQMVNG
jgi:membrane protease YdiL (CAAX protease family)